MLMLTEKDMVERAKLAGDLNCHTVFLGELAYDCVL